MKTLADELFKDFREHSVSEFFRKNAAMLGYTGKIRSLTTVIHEGVTNAIDAAEEADVLPDISVVVKKIGEDPEHLKVVIGDNASGIPEEFIPDVFGKMLAGTKLHRHMQSLVGDEPIICRENGEVRLTTIGELCDRYLIGEGVFDASKLNIEVPSFDESYRYSWKKVSQLIKHKLQNEIFRIRTEYGWEIKVTGCHSLFSLDENLQVRVVKVRDLKEGDCILAPLRFPQTDERSELDLIKYVEGKGIYLYGVPNSEFGRLRQSALTERKAGKKILVVGGVRVKEETFKIWESKCYVPLFIAKSLGLEGKKLRTYKRELKFEFPAKLEINKDIVWLIGMYLAEGHIDRRTVGFTLGKHEQEKVERILRALKVLNVPRKLIERENSYRINAYSEVLASFLSMMCGKGARKKKVPDFAFALPGELRIELLRGIYDGDGHLFKNRNQLVLGTSSESIATGLSYLWMTFGIPASMRGRNDVNTLPGGYLSNGEVYLIDVFADGVELLYGLRRKRTKTTYPKIPVELLNPFRKSFTLKSPLIKVGTSLTGDQALMATCFGRTDSAQRAYATVMKSIAENEDFDFGYWELNNFYLKQLKLMGLVDDSTLTKKGHEYLKNLDAFRVFLNSDLTPLKVKGIEQMDGGYEYVYDVSVPETENFVAGRGCFAVHNSRGQQGIGISGAVMFGQITSGKPARVCTSTGNGEVVRSDVMIDVDKNEGRVVNGSKAKGDWRGTRVELELKDVVCVRSRYGPLNYLRMTAIANPHARITLTEPDGTLTVFERATGKVPERPKPLPLHPWGVMSDDLLALAKHTKSRTIAGFLAAELSRVTKAKVGEIHRISGVDLDKKPSELTWEDAERIITAFKQVKFMAPPTEGLRPIGVAEIESGMKQILQPEFVHAVTRPPKVYRGGLPFVVEVGIAYGGGVGKGAEEAEEGEEAGGMELLRFANRAPLIFDQGGCAITSAVRSIDWRRYGVDIATAPMSLFIHMVSAYVPYTSAGKQSIADEPEVYEEIRATIMEAARELRRFLYRKIKVKEKQERAGLFEQYLPVIAKKAADLAGVKEPDLRPLLKKIAGVENAEES